MTINERWRDDNPELIAWLRDRSINTFTHKMIGSLVRTPVDADGDIIQKRQYEGPDRFSYVGIFDHRLDIFFSEYPLMSDRCVPDILHAFENAMVAYLVGVDSRILGDYCPASGYAADEQAEAMAQRLMTSDDPSTQLLRERSMAGCELIPDWPLLPPALLFQLLRNPSEFASEYVETWKKEPGSLRIFYTTHEMPDPEDTAVIDQLAQKIYAEMQRTRAKRPCERRHRSAKSTASRQKART